MEALEAIHTRASQAALRPERPERACIEALLDAAVRAPNHRLTEPWRFTVLAGAARDDLGELLARLRRASDPAAGEERISRERDQPRRAPVIVAVVSLAGPAPIVTHENVCATAAAVENLLLAAHATGLGAYWRTGDLAYAPEVLHFLHAPADARFLGFVYLGLPAADAPARHTPRTPAADLTEWRGWEE